MKKAAMVGGFAAMLVIGEMMAVGGERLTAYTEYMEPEREDEILLNVAAGLDPLTAFVAASDDPPKKRLGCLAVLLVGIALALALIW